MKACQFDAIHVVDGVAVVDKEKCVACGKCVATCPKGLIELVPYKAEHLVQCSSHDKGPAVKKVCTAGCIGCTLCTKQCEFDAIHMENNVAVIDYEKCTNCGACMKACPRGLITSVPASKKVHVACANLDKGKAAMSVCGNSCIGCGLCEKECKKDAIHVVNGVAVIDYDKCVGCKLCTKVCPRDAILPKATAEEKEKYKAIKKAQAEKAAAAKKAAEEAAAKAAEEAAAKAAAKPSKPEKGKKGKHDTNGGEA